MFNITTSICKVTYQTVIAKGMTDMWLYCPEIARLSKPGQFVQVKCEGHILRRPISICDTNKHSIRIVFEVRGEGTKWMSEIKLGDSLDILGPLGHGFDLGDTFKKSIFVGGGIGVPPLFAASKPFGKNATIVLGFRNSDAAILVDEFKANGATVLLASDDGSLGYHGLVTVPLAEHLNNNHADIIFTCGPKPMLKGVAKIAEQKNISCQISLEQRMGCGVGACLVCACKIKKEDGGWRYAQVCKYGPVVNANEVIWDD